MAHFWYSKKMALLDDDQQLPKCKVVILGETVELEYTVMSQTKQHGCSWGDEIYLGEGQVSFVPESNENELDFITLFEKIQKAKRIKELPNA
jgi:hypothetical protein